MSPGASHRWDSLWINANAATMRDGDLHYGLLPNAAIAITGERIAWLGSMADLPGAPDALASAVVDCRGQLVTPGLIDCHTHLVYAGNRAHEFEMRLNGASYEELASAGGGIRATVAATRAASEEALFAAALPRLHRMLQDGVTTVEIKSGYGLTLPDEAKQLRVARRLGEQLPVTVKTSFLGAHALPDEYADEADRYVSVVCEEMIPAISQAGLADAVDVFCESIGFSPAQAERIFAAAARHGLPVKIHAEQLSALGGAGLAARHHALSADHLEYLDAADIALMQSAGTVAVLLPGAFYYLRETRCPPIQALRDAGVPIAVATDCNPGSSPIFSLLLVMNMACTLFQLTPEEALAGTTRNAARALGIAADTGTLEVGKRADLVRWHAEHPAELSYVVGLSLCEQVLVGGVPR